MKTTKKYAQLSLAALMVANAIPAYAANAAQQAAQPQIPAVVSTVPPLIAAKIPGVYEKIDTNTDKFVELFKQIDDGDKRYVIQTMGILDDKMKAIYDKHLKAAKELYNKGVTSTKGVSLQEYLDLSTKLETDLAAAINSIELMLQVPSARANGQNQAKVDNGRVMVNVQNSHRSVDFSGVIADVKAKLEAIQAKINDIAIPIQHPSKGAIMQKFGDTLHPDLMRAFSAEQINALRDEATDKEKNAKIARDYALSQLGAKRRKNLETFINTYGKDETRRFETDEKGLTEAMDRLEENSLVGSMARFVKGTQVGAFGTPDTRRQFNFNRLPGVGSNEIVLNNATYFTYPQLEQQRKYILEVFKTQTDRGVLNMWARMFDPNFSLLARLSSFVNMIKGERSWSFANAFALSLMLRDIEEEQMISRPEGLADLRISIQERVIKRSGSQLAVDKLKQLASVINEASGAPSKNNSVGSASGGALDVGRELGTILNKYLTAVNDANALRKRADELENGLNQLRTLEKERLDDLFNVNMGQIPTGEKK